MRDQASQLTGLALDDQHRFLVGTGAGTFVIALGPDEMRDLATRLLASADALEASAAAEASAAIARAGRLS